MKMKIILCFLILVIGTNIRVNSQTTVQIGMGTLSSPTTLYSPFYRFSASSATDFSRSNIIYTATEMAAAGISNGSSITKLAFNKTNAGASVGPAIFQIYMANTSNTIPLLTTTTWASILSTHTLVYNSTSQTIPSTIGWIEFTLSTPIIYTGGSLEIATHWDISAVSGSPFTDKVTWEYTDGFATYNIGAVGTTSAPATLNATTTTYKHRPNIKITYAIVNQPMVFDSSTTLQPITTPIVGIQNQQIIAALKVNVTGNQSPFDLTAVTFNTNGTTNSANISKAQLFYTNTPAFSNAVQLGSDIMNPSGSFTFNPSSSNTLASGANYFWLTYDVDATTPDGNILDAECTSFTLSGSGGVLTPAVTNPGSGRQVLFPLTGIKTINSALPASGSNYQSFTSAVAALAAVGVGTSGVTFNVASGTYTEQINLTQFPGVSLSNPVVFQSATGIANDVVLQFTPTSSANYVVQFNGADYITIQNMTIQLTGTIGTYACVINGIGMSDYISLYGNKIIGYTGATTGTAYAAIWFQSGTANMSMNTTIQNNIIQYGSYALYIYGGSSTVLETGNKILNNTIYDFNNYGIYAYGHDAIKIEGNTVTGKGTGSTEYGIYMYYCDNFSTALKNKIYNRGTTTSYGLNIYYCDGVPGQEVLIANNFITITTSTGTAYGMYSYYGNYQKIYHNSVNVAAGSATAGVAMYFTSATTGTYSNNEVKNNNFVNSNGGLAVYITSNAVTVNYITAMDYNNLYTTGTNIGYYNSLAVLNDITAWRTASGKDVNSISANPQYLSSTDLHITATALNSSCPFLIDVPDDIDGDARGVLTDMGADEINVFNNDVKVKALYTLGQFPIDAGSQHVVKALIENTGANAQTNISVTLNISGANSFSNTYVIASLSSAAVDTVTFASFSPSNTGINNVKVSVPNDDYISNNELNYRQEITSNTFAYADTSAVVTNLGFNTSAGYFVAKYTITGSKQIYTSKAFIVGASTVGKELYGVVFDDNGNILDTSFHKIIAASDINTWVSFNFVHPANTTVNNNEFYIGIAQVANAVGYYPLGCQSENPARRETYFYNSGLTTYNPVEALNFGRFMLAAVVGDPANKDALVTQITNPVSGCGLNMQTVTIKIKNEGTQSILASQNALMAYYKIDNGNVISQNVNVDIAPLATIDFTFATQANLAAPTTDVNYLITAWTDLQNDPVRFNDTLRKVVNSGYVPPDPIANNSNVNYAASVLLTVTPANSTDTLISWYQNVSDTLSFHQGLTYNTPALYDTATYWVTAGRAGSASSLLITEVNLGGTDGFEIQNISGGTLNTAGWVVAVSNSYSDINALNANIWTLGSSMPAGQILIKDDNAAGGQYWGSNLLWNPGVYPTFTGWIIILDNTGKIVDYVAWGWKSANIQALSTTINGFPITIGNKWSGDGVIDPALDFIVRQVYDNNNSSDFVNVATGSLGTANPGMTGGLGGGSLIGCVSNKVPIKAIVTNFPALDASIISVNLPTDIIDNGTNVPVKATIKNFGLNDLNSVSVGWSINGVNQTPYLWTGLLNNGSSSAELTIANNIFTTPGTLEIKVWTFDPNASIDNYLINDTVTTTIKVAMAGDYSIGASGADYTTISQAVDVLKTVGVSDNVIFNIQPGTYTEKLLITQVTGANDTKGITFQSENMDSTSVIISDSSLATTDNYILRLNGADYITIKNLTIQNKGVTYGRAIDMLGGTNFVNIANNVIISSATGTASTTSGIYSATGLDSNLVIENNVIQNGYYGIFLTGTSTAVKESNNIIRNNRLIDFYYYGMYLYYQNNISVVNNYLKNRSTAGSQYGIYHYYNDNVTNLKNQVYLRGTSTCYGIFLSNNNASTGSSLVANNFIAQSVGTGTTYALYNNVGKNIKYFFNTVSVAKGSVTAASNCAFYNTASVAGANIQVLNNIFANTGGGYAYYANSILGIDSSNNNCLYATGANLAYWGAAARTNLVALQAASFRDAYSVSVNPNFADSSSDLHASNVALTEKGTSVPEVTDDIDGQIRGIIPAIGADEFLGVRTLNLTVFFEGLFNGVNINEAYDDMGIHWGAGIADKITVELHNSVTPSLVEATFTNQSLSTAGLCTVIVPASLADQYYIVVRHRNSITTWSSLPMSFNTSIINYDFTTAATQAYGDNLKEVSTGVFAVMVGDVNQDGLVDGSDMSDTETENNNFSIGYIVTDVNGDGLVDGSDMSIVETANNNFVSEIMP